MRSLINALIKGKERSNDKKRKGTLRYFVYSRYLSGGEKSIRFPRKLGSTRDTDRKMARFLLEATR